MRLSHCWGDVIRPDTLGCSANGLSLASKALINPTANGSTLYLYYLYHGRVIDIPVTGDGFIQSCTPSRSRKPNDPKGYVLPGQDWSDDLPDRGQTSIRRDVRWDAELDWQRNESAVCLCCRVSGLPFAFFNPWNLVKKAARATCIQSAAFAVALR